jgi:hypothetical protein
MIGSGLRASTIVRRLREVGARDLADKVQASVDASGACDLCGREERDPIVALSENEDRILVACPWCSGDAVFNAWRAEAQFFCSNPSVP